MTDGDQRLDAVLFAAIKHAVVEFQPLLVRLGLYAGGEDAGPVDGGAEGLEAHLGEEGDVLFVVVVEINGFVAGVQPVGADAGGHPFRAGMGAIGAHIGHTGALAVHIPGTLKLVGGTGAAPQEIITKNTHGLFLLFFLAEEIYK